MEEKDTDILDVETNVESEDEEIDIVEDEPTEDAEHTEEETEEESEEEETEEPEGEFNVDDLEFDENGDLIIPDDIDKGISNAEDGKETEVVEEKPDAKDVEIKSLKQRLEELVSQSKDTLKKLGVEGDDVLKGLAELAAETDGVSTEEYLKARAEEKAKADAEAIAHQTEFEKIAAADLAELQAKFPETKSYKHIKDMPKEILAEFAKNRDLGLPAVKAYAAANPDGIRESAVASAKAEKSGKEHLQSSVPKGSKSTAIKMTRTELNEWRGLFPDKSDKEIVALYRKTAKK